MMFLRFWGFEAEGIVFIWWKFYVISEVSYSERSVMNTDFFCQKNVTLFCWLLYCYRPKRISSYERVPLAAWWLTPQCHAEAVWSIMETERQADGRFTNRLITRRMKWWNVACCPLSPLRVVIKVLNFQDPTIWLLKGEYGWLFI